MSAQPKEGRRAGPSMTAKQARYVSFIFHYTLLNGQAPAEADMQRFFGVTPPAVHQMIVGLEKAGLITRVPGQARTIRVLVPRDQIPALDGVETAQSEQETKPKPPNQAVLVDPADLISLQTAAEKTGYTPENFRLLAAQGKLQAWFVGNTWLTTMDAVQAYIANDPDRRKPRAQ